MSDIDIQEWESLTDDPILWAKGVHEETEFREAARAKLDETCSDPDEWLQDMTFSHETWAFFVRQDPDEGESYEYARRTRPGEDGMAVTILRINW